MCRTPCAASSTEVVSPTRLPPTTRTGTSCSITDMHSPHARQVARVHFTGSPQPQYRHRILLQNQFMHLGLEACLLEVFDPSVGGDQRIIRSKQHLACQ